MRIDILSNMKEVLAIRPQWDALSRKFASPLLSFDWFIACIETLHNTSSLFVIVIRHGSEINAIAPLFLNMSKKPYFLEIIGSPFLHEPTGLLFSDMSALSDLLKVIGKLKYPVYLNRIEFESPICNETQTIISKNAVILRRQASSSCYISCDSDWEMFQSAIPRKTMANLRNKKNRINKIGNSEFLLVNPDRHELQHYFNIFVQIESNNWKGSNKTSLQHAKHLQDFYWRYCVLAMQKGILRIAFLEINDTPVAARICVEYSGSLWGLKIGYDHEWKKLSPGIQLVMKCIEYSFSKNLNTHEFLGSEEKWQHTWPVQTRKYVSIFFFPLSARGIYSLVSMVIYYALRRLSR